MTTSDQCSRVLVCLNYSSELVSTGECPQSDKTNPINYITHRREDMCTAAIGKYQPDISKCLDIGLELQDLVCQDQVLVLTEY